MFLHVRKRSIIFTEKRKKKSAAKLCKFRGFVSVAADVGRITAAEQNRTLCNSSTECPRTHAHANTQRCLFQANKCVNVPPTGPLAD